MALFKEKRKLMIVYDTKDELALNYFKKLIETDDDDTENNKIVGSEDDTVSVMGWTEKVYLDNKKKGNVSNKIIFLDDTVEGVDKVTPIMDVKFDKFGISYGFAGNQAVISIDESKITDEKTYSDMEKYFSEYYKENLPDENEDIDNKKTDNHGDFKKKKMLAIILTAAYPFVGIPFIADAVKAKRKLRDAMFLFAISKFYLEELDEFMKT